MTVSQKGQIPRGQLPLAIWDVPAKVRAHGLVEAHSHPLVSRGRKGADGRLHDVHREPAAEAWRHWASLELTRSPSAFAALAFDVEGQDGTEQAMEWFMDHPEVYFNWAVTRHRSGGTHFVFTLAKPVLYGEHAKAKPLHALARIGEYLRQQLDADPSYQGGLSHNPMARPQGPGLSTVWGRCDPYELAELGASIPHGWRIPQARSTDAGRNDYLTRQALRWAGSPTNLRQSVLDYLLGLYQQLPAEQLKEPHPFTLAELEGIARSVERIRQGWIANGDFGPKGDARRSAWGRRWGKASGAARRKRTRERDGEIVNAAFLGESAASIARRMGLTEGAIRRVIRRDAPLLRRLTIQAAEPWKLEGVSRRTWYRRQQGYEPVNVSVAQNRSELRS